MRGRQRGLLLFVNPDDLQNSMELRSQPRLETDEPVQVTVLASISTPNNSVNTNGVFGGEDTAQANWMISFLSPNQGIGMG